jgi:predicted MFS family arabinose efflux permease
MAMRLITGSAVLTLALGALAIDTAPSDDGQGAGVWAGLWRALKAPKVRSFLAAVGLVGIGTSTMLVYQVPAMTAAGLPLAAASFWAGVRGFAQLGGRVPLLPLVDRLGVSTAFRVAISAIALGMVILAYAGTPLVAAIFAVIAGFGVGALSPLQGMQLKEIFDESGLGTAMGLASLVFLVVGSTGPALAGTIAEATGSRQLPVILAGVVTAIAAVVTPSVS